jgi:hypothetical protein
MGLEKASTRDTEATTRGEGMTMAPSPFEIYRLIGKGNLNR